MGLATFCILAESFGRLKGSRHNKTVSVSIGQDVFKSDVCWSRVILSGSGSSWPREAVLAVNGKSAYTRHYVNVPRPIALSATGL
jgi:hypothetical protein